MIEWMPGADNEDRGGNYPVQNNGPTVIVLHTTETSGRASYSGTEPHFEIDRDGSILQYISLARTAKALYNAPGGGETNRRRGRIIQLEIVNRAAEIRDITDGQLAGLADALRFVDSQLPFEKTAAPQGFHGSDEGIYPYVASEGSPIRFSVDEWENFGGICGHQHVIENDHWDPGRFPMDRLLPIIGGAPTPPTPPAKEIYDMPCTYNYDGAIWAYGDNRLVKLTHPDQASAHRDSGAKDIGDRSKPVHEFYSALAGPQNVIELAPTT